MATFLLASRSVHTSAAACDYLGDRLDADDTVMVLGVTESAAPDGDSSEAAERDVGGSSERDAADLSERDVGDAINVARARLAPATVWTERRAGDPADAILDLATEIEADELLVGRQRGDSVREGAKPDLGSTAEAVAARSEQPVVILPSE